MTTASPDLMVVITVLPVPALSLTFNPVAVMVPVLGKPSVNTSPESVTGALVGAGDGVGVAVGAAAGLIYWLLTYPVLVSLLFL